MLCSCTSEKPLAGNTVETGNARVAGIVRDREGKPVSAASVYLVPATYNPLSDDMAVLPSDTTDDDGSYALYADSGMYNVIAEKPANQTRAMQSGISVPDSSEISVDTITLKSPASAVLALDSAAIHEAGHLYIPGTFTAVHMTQSDIAAGMKTIRELPASYIPQIRYRSSVSVPESDKLIAAGFAAIEGETVTAPTGRLPDPWQSASIGETPAGGTVYNNDRFIVLGGGPDIWDVEDGFHYVYRMMSGDWQITMRLDSMPATEQYARAGIMARSSLDPGSANAMITIDNNDPELISVFHYRGAPGEITIVTPDSLEERPPQNDVDPPVWLRLSRSGNLFAGYVSPDRTQWYFIGEKTIAMETEVYLGMAVTSHTEHALLTAVFDSLAIQ